MPEQLIQSQQVTLTGTDRYVRKLLKELEWFAQTYNCTVTLTPTSVTDATVGVTQDSQQNPRHSEAAVNRAAKAAFERMRDVDFSFRAAMPRSWEELTEASRNNWRDSAEAALNTSPDAQGSVTEQSQQKSRQVPDALLERLCGMVYATRGEQHDHGYINDREYAALVRLRHSGHGSIETVLTALAAQPHHKERDEQGE